MTAIAPDARAASTPTGAPRTRGPRAVLLLPAGVCLVTGSIAGLVLLGLLDPATHVRQHDVHGMVMVVGFLGTVIGLERAVALGRTWAYAAPVLLGLGGMMLLPTAVPLLVGRTALLVGLGTLVAIYARLWARNGDACVLVQAAGAALAAGAVTLWSAGYEVPEILPWLVAFVVLTIAGERVELARVMTGLRSSVLLGWALGVVAAVLATLLWPGVGVPVLGITILGLVGWLLRWDVARRTIHGTGQVRFVAACMLAGYAWLAVAGVNWALGGEVASGGRYDLAVHAVFLGFAFLMIMAHAPMILPAVLRRPLPYHPVMWLPPVLLVASLTLRVWIGDGMGVLRAWQVGGVGNIVALATFVGIVVWRVVGAGGTTSEGGRP